MTKGGVFEITPLNVDRTYDLRRRVLRNNDPDAVVRIAGDDWPAAWHLGAVVAADVVATASFYPAPCLRLPGVTPAWQLRFMAVDPAHQGSGIGRAVIDSAVDRLLALGCRLLWANARDSALTFYLRLGFTVSGESFADPGTGLPHTVVLRPLPGD